MKGDVIMTNFNIVKIAKIGGVILSVGGMIITSWVTGKENELTLAKLVEERLQK